MMYFAAISVLFMRFKPIQMVYTWFNINKKKYPKEYKQIEIENKKMLLEYKIKSEANKKFWENKILSLTSKKEKEKVLHDKKIQTLKQRKPDGWKKTIIKIQNQQKITNSNLNNEIKEYKLDIKDILIGYKNINNHRKTQIRLFKIQKQQEFYNRIHEVKPHNSVVKVKGGT
jgi:hypothetical protein